MNITGSRVEIGEWLAMLGRDGGVRLALSVHSFMGGDGRCLGYKVVWRLPCSMLLDTIVRILLWNTMKHAQVSL